jgi:hypothetical protein
MSNGNGKTAKVQELRRSGAAGKHGDRRTKRNRTRGAQKRSAMRDWA